MSETWRRTDGAANVAWGSSCRTPPRKALSSSKPIGTEDFSSTDAGIEGEIDQYAGPNGTDVCSRHRFTIHGPIAALISRWKVAVKGMSLRPAVEPLVGTRRAT